MAGMSDDSTKCSTDVNQTIQWARESLQRRRSELLEKKNELSASYSSNVDLSQDDSSPQTVHQMLERGHALLAEVEAHSEILGQYTCNTKLDQTPIDRRYHTAVSPHISNETTNDSYAINDKVTSQGQNEVGFMSRFLLETIHIEKTHLDNNVNCSKGDRFKFLSNIPTERPVWDNNREVGNMLQSDTVRCQSISNVEYSNENHADLGVLLQEGEARARLDELIATIRRQGDDPSKLLERDVMSAAKQVSSFDPSAMKAAKRAALKEVKRAEAAAAAEVEARKLSSFKALPLPGGVHVENNLYAPTQSFKGKQAGTVERLLRQDTKCEQFNDSSPSMSGNFGGFDGISVVISQASNVTSFTCCGAGNEEDKKRAEQVHAEKGRRKRQLLNKVNQAILEDMAADIEEDDASIIYDEEDIVEDVSTLHQHIARLEAKLRRKKFQRSATLNDIVDIDLNALFETLLRGEVGDGARKLVSRLKERVCVNILDDGLSDKTQNHIHELNRNAAGGNDENKHQRKRSLFRRHEDWVKERERKRSDARSHLEEEAMSVITGIPELAHAKQSWRKAKEAHDEALKKIAEEEKIRSNEKEAKEKLANEMKLKEITELQNQARSKLRSIKSDANKEDQMKHLALLSRPRQSMDDSNVIRKESLVMGIDKDSRVLTRQQSKLPSKANYFDPYKTAGKATGNTPPDTFSSSQSNGHSVFPGKRFSDMDDMEFKKMIKRIGKATKKLKDPHLSNDIPIELKLGDPENLAKSSFQEDDVWKSGSYCSSNAQSVLMKRLNDSKIEESPGSHRKAMTPNTENLIHKQGNAKFQSKKEEPYEKYERHCHNASIVSFFDPGTSSTENGRFRVRDARGFLPETMSKFPYQAKAGEEGVTLLVGKKGDDELVISIIFDLSYFDETSASKWWIAHKERFVGDNTS